MSVLSASRSPAVVFALVACALSTACAPLAPPERAEANERFGLYRGSLVEDGDDPRHFRLLLFAALPDRLHAEVLPPFGPASVIIDGGDGKVSIYLRDEGAAFAGVPSEGAFRKAIGLSTTLEGLVRAVVLGAPAGEDVTIERDPKNGPGLPRTLTIRSGSRALRIEMVTLRKLRRGDGGVGTGTPPAGVEVRPIAELEEVDVDPILPDRQPGAP